MIGRDYSTPVLDVKVKSQFSGRPVRSRRKRRKGEEVGGREEGGRGVVLGCGHDDNYWDTA